MIFNKKGIILEGDYKNWWIVAYEDADTGGYYLVIWSENGNEGYDDWFEHKYELEEFFQHNYVVKWTNKDYFPRAIDK